MEKVCRVLSSLLLIVLAVMATILLVPHLLGMQTLAVLSGSMEPAVSPGDMVIVKPMNPEEIQVGDIITFTLPGGDMVATHRVIEKRDASAAFVTKGDANQTDDGEIAYTRLVGKVLLTVPYMGTLASLLKGREAILMGAGLLVVLVILTVLPIVFRKPPETESI